MKPKKGKKGKEPPPPELPPTPTLRRGPLSEGSVQMVYAVQPEPRCVCGCEPSGIFFKGTLTRVYTLDVPGYVGYLPGLTLARVGSVGCIVSLCYG